MNRLVAALLLAPLAASAAPTRGEVERLLGGYEPPARAADFHRLGPGVDHLLVVIAIDPATTPIRRNRALSALSLVPSAEGRDLLRAVMRRNERAVEGAELLDFVACVRALRGFGPDVAPELIRLLVHPSPDVRQTAAESLAAARAAVAIPSLRLRVTVERDPNVLRALLEAVAELERR